MKLLQCMGVILLMAVSVSSLTRGGYRDYGPYVMPIAEPVDATTVTPEPMPTATLTPIPAVTPTERELGSHTSAPTPAPVPDADMPSATPAPPQNNERYAGITVTAEERQAIAEIAYWENGNQPDEAIQGVAEVILNRLKDALSDGAWARYSYKNVMDVISHSGQFTTYTQLGKLDPPKKFHDLTERAITGEHVLPETAMYFNTSPENGNIIAVIQDIYFCGNYKW
jgi:spore germination cell wall hydrolase CwlJ-like protein